MVKHFLTADRFNPVLFLEMRERQFDIETVSRLPAYDYIWETLLHEPAKTTDYQMVDQYADVLVASFKLNKILSRIVMCKNGHLFGIFRPPSISIRLYLC